MLEAPWWCTILCFVLAKCDGIYKWDVFIDQYDQNTRNAIKHCTLSGPQKHITKESDGFQNHSTQLTMFWYTKFSRYGGLHAKNWNLWYVLTSLPWLDETLYARVRKLLRCCDWLSEFFKRFSYEENFLYYKVNLSIVVNANAETSRFHSFKGLFQIGKVHCQRYTRNLNPTN